MLSKLKQYLGFFASTIGEKRGLMVWEIIDALSSLPEHLVVIGYSNHYEKQGTKENIIFFLEAAPLLGKPGWSRNENTTASAIILIEPVTSMDSSMTVKQCIAALRKFPEDSRLVDNPHCFSLERKRCEIDMVQLVRCVTEKENFRDMMDRTDYQDEVYHIASCGEEYVLLSASGEESTLARRP